MIQEIHGLLSQIPSPFVILSDEELGMGSGHGVP